MRKNVWIRCLVLALFLSAAGAEAQTPNAASSAPATSFLGEQFCFDVTLTNSGPPGFGPYFLLFLEPELTLNSASIFGIGTSTQTVGVFPASPGNMLVDPISGTTVSGPDGHLLYTVQPPIGSVVDGGPPLDVETCITIDPGAEPFAPLALSIQPGYEFGDTATGANGPILGTRLDDPVTPTIVIFEKENTAPEEERPPGWPFDYVFTVDIANGAQLENLRITDTIPPEFQFNGPLQITGGVGCTDNSAPPLIDITCTSAVGTTADSDIQVTFEVEPLDILDETACDSQDVTNAAEFDSDYISPMSGTISLPSPIPADTTVQVEHVSLQKSASPTLARPGDTVTYTLALQVTDFGDVSALVVDDLLPDGTAFVSHGTLVVGGTTIAITPTVVPNPDGTTDVSYDVGAVAGNIAASTAISLSYTADILQSYTSSDGGGPGPVRARDRLTNTVSVTHDMLAGGSGCGDGSGAAVDILPLVVTKSILNPLPEYEPGDVVTYVLRLDIPSGDVQDIIFEDFFPLPVIDSTTLDTNPVIGSGGAGENQDIRFGSNHTLGIGYQPATSTSCASAIETFAATNSARICWPDISTTTAQTVEVEVDMTLVDAPYADNLILQNLLQVLTNNTVLDGLTDIQPSPITIRSPELTLTKGISFTDGNGSIAGPTTPVDDDLTDADAADLVRFVITVENLGGAEAYDVTITDPPPTGLTGCTLESVADGLGTDYIGGGFTSGDLFSTGLVLSNNALGAGAGGLEENDGNPAAGGSPYSNDTVFVTYSCDLASTVEPRDVLLNTAGATWASQPGAMAFAQVTDDAQITIDDPSIGKTREDTSPDPDTSDSTVQIGELIEYQVVVTVPAGTSASTNLDDRLDTGLVISSVDGVTLGSDITSSVGNEAAILAGAVVSNGGRDLDISFGTVTNAATDNADRTITIDYTAIVTDSGANVAGANRNNRARWEWDGVFLQANAPNTLVVEPAITILKTANPTNGDEGDVVTFTVALSVSGGIAFDVTVTDTISDPNLVFIPGSVTAAGGTVTTGNGGGDSTIQVDYASLASGANVSITYQASIAVGVVSGSTLNNTAGVSWDSLPGNPTGTQRSYGPVTDDATVSVDSPTMLKTVIATSEASTGTSQGGTEDDLTIGETVTYRLTVTVPEGTSNQILIRDSLPASAQAVLEYVSASVFDVGMNLTATIPNPTPVVQDLNLGDGRNDTVELDFGTVTNAGDMAVTNEDRIFVDVVARVVDVPANAGGDTATNTGLVQFGAGLNATDTAVVDLVEPVLQIDKSSPTTTGDAGDTVRFTLTVQHAGSSTADAFDLALSDTLPAGLNFVSFPAGGTCDVPPTTGPAESAGTITASWDSFPLTPGGQICEILIDVTIDNSVTPGQSINNQATLDWDSLPADPGVEERSSSTNDNHIVTISSPGVNKTVFATSEGSTGTAISGPEPDLTIGETVTYRFTVTIPEGTAPNVNVTDQLPTGIAVLAVESSQLVSIGNRISGPGLPALGTAGTASDTNVDTFDDNVAWSLGDLFNNPDGAQNGGDQIVFEVVARVVDDALNTSADDDLVNTATFTFTGGSANGTALVDLVEPELALDKRPTPDPAFIDAGDTITFELQIDHTVSSTADAFSLEITDVLANPGTTWAGNVATDCPSLSTNATAAPTIVFTLPTLTLATDTCTISYDVTIDNTVSPGQTLTNTASLQYDSQPTFTSGETRRRTTGDMASATVLAPTLVKLTSMTSLSDTMQSQYVGGVEDLAIGETVDYTLTVLFPEGVTDNAVVVDTLPVGAAGILEAIGASITSIGTRISTSLAGTPTLSDVLGSDGLDDTVSFDFGTVTNTPDNVADAGDRITLLITARVINDPRNADGDNLTNDAALTYATGPPVTDSADVDVVEPDMGLTKSLGAASNGTIVSTISLTNNGTAPAYDVLIVDVLDDSVWDLGSFAPITVPAGYLMSTAAGPGAGQLTVSLSSDGGAAPPLSSVEPSETVQWQFSLRLATPQPPSPVSNTATNTLATTLPGNDPNERDQPDVPATDMLDLPILDATKADTLVSDDNASGGASPGETIRYTLQITNSGSAAATNVVVDDTPGINTTLVAGSVVAPGGTVVTGNTGGDTAVQVTFASVPVGTVTVTFDVLIDSPFPNGVTQIANQAMIGSNELPDFPSDDPDTPATDDPTVTPVDAAPDLTINKDDGGITTAPGGLVSYTLNYSNVGTQVAVASVLTDTVPVGSTFYAAASTAGWVCLPDTSAGSTCTLTLGNLAASANGSATFAVTVDDPLASGIEQLDNTAQIADDGSNGADPTPGNNTNSDTTPITADVDLQISKDDGGVSTTPGSTLVYTLDYANVGDQTATGALITETVPDHTTFNAAASTAGWSCVAVTAGSACSFTVGTLAGNGAGGSIDFALDVDDPLPSTVTQIDNGATIGDDGANGPDLTLGDNSDSDFTPVNADVDLRLTKTDGVTTAAPGDLLVYGIDFENAGSQSATGVVLTETVPEHTTFDAGSSTAGWICAPDGSAGSTCTLAIGAVAGSGGGGSADFAVRVDNPVPGSATQIANAVQIADDGSNGPDPTPVDNSAADTDTLERTPVLEVTKTDALLIDADTSLDATPGDTLRYTVVVSLTGDSGTLGASFTDAPGANTSLVAGSVITTLGTITSGNSGGDTTVAVDLGDLLSPTTATITFDVTIDDPLVPAGTTQIVNQGSAQSADEPGEPSDDPDTGGDDDPTITPIGTTPVLDVTKADGLLIDADTSLDVSLGDTLRYTVELTNTGLGDATGVTLTDTPDASSSLVAGTVTTTQGSVTLGNSGGDTTVEVDLGTLGAGATATVTFDVSVDAVPPSGFLRNQGITRSNELPDEPSDDPDTPNDDDPTDTPVGTQPLVEAVKTDLLAVDADGDGSVGPGDTLRFVVTLENTGAADANGARFRDTPGANTTLVATTVQTSQGTVTTGNGAGDGTVDVDLGTLPAGAQATVAFDVLIDSPLPAGVVQVANQGTVSVDTLPDEPTDDPDTPGDDDPTTTPVGPMPELEVSKADQLLIDADTSSSVTPGDTLRYTLIVESVGTGGAQDVELNDAPGANTTLVAGSVTTSLGTVTEGNTLGDTTVRVDLGTLPTGTMATITFDVTIAAVLVPSTTSAVANQALVTSSNAPDEPSDDPDTASDDDPTVTPLGSGPALDALKSDTLVTDADASGGLTAGDTLEYRVEISNFGGGVANAVVFEDGPVANATLVVGSVTTTVGTVTTGNAGGDTTVTVDLGALAGGSSATVTFQVLLDLPLPAGVTEIVNQGTVRSTNHPDTPTDDPDTVAADDPTRTPIAGSPALDSTKQDFLRLDTDGNSALSPGDTQRYVLEVTNTSATQATGVRVIDMPDALTSLINGTVAASQGLVLEGNGAGDSRIVVALGAVPGNSQATITYDVVLDGVFPPGSTTLRNQGTVESDQLPDVPTDDPDTPTPDDPTMTPVTLTPTLQSTKVVDLEDDVDASRSTTPGDVLRYTVDITSGGDAGLTNVTFDDAPDTNTQLVVGSVTTSQGVVVVGNSGTDSTISVTIGSMPSGTTATIVYDVRINDPLVPVDTTELVNQGVLRSTELPDVLTDDPGTASPGDPTTTIVVSNLYAVPTLGEWALILFAAFLAALGTLWLRRGA